MYSKNEMTAPGIGYQDLKLMVGCPPPPEKQIGKHNWDSPPYNRWSFQNMSQLFPVAPIHRGSKVVTQLERNDHSLDAVRFTCVDGSEVDLETFLVNSYTDGFLVLHRGRIITERYFNGMKSNTLHLLQSVSKTIIGSLAGRLISQGKIDPLATVGTYVPELLTSGYADATIENLLNMQTGVKFREDYTDPSAQEYIHLDIASGWRERGEHNAPETIHDLLKSIGSDRDHGQIFEYRSVDTDVLGWVCEKAGGDRLPNLLSREIWSKLGTEHDANITVDRVGTSLADGGMSATLRDVGRFAQMYLQGGFFNGEQIVPEAFVRACGTGSTAAFEVLYGHYVKHYPNSAYSNQCWVVNSQKGIFCARGVFGQCIYWDVESEVSVVKFSTWPDFVNPEWTVNTFRACEAIIKSLKEAE